LGAAKRAEYVDTYEKFEPSKQAVSNLRDADGLLREAPSLLRQQIGLAFCWVHVRRNFYELADISQVATEVLRRIAFLYGVEDEVRGSPAG